MEQHLRSTHLSPCLYVHSAMPNVMLLVWICCCLLLSFPFLQANTEYSLLCQNSLFMFHSLLSSLSLMDSLTLVSSVSLSLSCVFSLPHTLVVVYIPHGQQRTAQFSAHVAENPCNTQSPNPLTICSSSHMQTQSPTTDH